MQRPRDSIMVVGHPVIATPVCVVFGGFAVFSIIHDGFSGATAVLLLLVGAVGNTARTVARFNAWKREWDGFDPDHKPGEALRNAVRWLLLPPFVVGVLWLYAGYSDPTSPAHVVGPLLVFGLPALWLARFLVRRRGRRTRPTNHVVTQAVSRPLPAPTVAEAYARLPEYLRPIFSPKPERQ